MPRWVVRWWVSRCSWAPRPTRGGLWFNGCDMFFLQVGPEYQGRLCSLCGNFSGDPGDDKVLPSRVPGSSDADFGNTWQSWDSWPG